MARGTEKIGGFLWYSNECFCIITFCINISYINIFCINILYVNTFCINCFMFRSFVSPFFRLFQSIPFVLVLLLVCTDTYSYYWVYMKRLVTKNQNTQALIQCFIFTPLLCLMLVSYVRTCFTSSGVKKNPPEREMDGMRLTECRKCLGKKPPRAHHCSICDECVLKMDHRMEI